MFPFMKCVPVKANRKLVHLRHILQSLHCCCETGIAYCQMAVYIDKDQQCVREGNYTLILHYNQKSLIQINNSNQA